MGSLQRVVLIAVLGLAVPLATGAVFFLSAGRWDLPVAWAAIAVLGLLTTSGMVLIDAGLLKERMKPGPGGQDYFLIYMAKLLLLASLIIAGLDVGRFHWSDSVPLVARITGLAGFTLGMGVAVWSMATNPFFSSVVRLQAERGHHLITTGPYRFVRHPGYAGISVGVPCLALPLGSWLSILPMLAFCALVLRRTRLEERFLREKLEGYTSYAEQVRYRLLPGVW